MASLHLFPKPSVEDETKRPKLELLTSIDGFGRPHSPRKSSLRDVNTVGHLSGVAMQVTVNPGHSVKIEPAEAHHRHSIVCSPLSPTLTSKSPFVTLSPVSDMSEEDVYPKPMERLPAIESKRCTPPPAGLPRKSTSLNRRNAYRRSSASSVTLGLRSASPGLVRSNRVATERKTPAPSPARMRSIFPRYQQDLPLEHQQYYPRNSASIDLPPHQVSKGSDAATSFAIPPDSSTASHELQPVADPLELLNFWDAAYGNGKIIGEEKTQLVMRREIDQRRKHTKMTFGSSCGTDMFVATIPDMPARPRDHGTEDSTREIMVLRQHPLDGISLPVAHLDCKTVTDQCLFDEDGGFLTSSQQVSSIFPQTAALEAIRAAANTRKASAIAHFDPGASSPEAMQLALHAVAEAKESEECELNYLPAGLEGSLQGQGRYELHHPRLGLFPMTIEGRISLTEDVPAGQRFGGRFRFGKITIHHPQSPSSSSLVSLDLASDTLELDMAALAKLDSPFMLDTVICSIICIATTETLRIARNHLSTSFAAPPKSPSKASEKVPKVKTTASSAKSVGSSKKRRSLFRRSSKDTVGFGREKEKPKLPAITRGLLHLLGFSFDAIVWMLSLGVKVLTKLVMDVTFVVEKM